MKACTGGESRGDTCDHDLSKKSLRVTPLTLERYDEKKNVSLFAARNNYARVRRRFGSDYEVQELTLTAAPWRQCLVDRVITEWQHQVDTAREGAGRLVEHAKTALLLLLVSGPQLLGQVVRGFFRLACSL